MGCKQKQSKKIAVSAIYEKWLDIYFLFPPSYWLEHRQGDSDFFDEMDEGDPLSTKDWRSLDTWMAITSLNFNVREASVFLVVAIFGPVKAN